MTFDRRLANINCPLCDISRFILSLHSKSDRKALREITVNIQA